MVMGRVSHSLYVWNNHANVMGTISGAPEFTDISATATTIALSWTQRGNVDSYTVSYNYTIRRCGSGPVSGSEEIGDDNARSFTLTDLEEDSDYTITLTANSRNSQTTSEQITTTTDTAGNNEYE